jgi:histidinol-phosphatase (PHP family)
MEKIPFPSFWGECYKICTYDEEKTRKHFFEAKEAFKGKIRLLYGIELGEPQLNRQPFAEFTARQSFDIILGSSHVLSGDIDLCMLDYTVVRPQDIIAHYLSDIFNMVRLGGFDVLAHIEYPLRYLPNTFGFESTLMPFREQIREILKLCAGKGIALEINGYGARKSQKSLTLESFIIKDYLELGGEYLTYGSDAHAASHLLAGKDEALELARACGARYFAYFENRKAVPIKI